MAVTAHWIEATTQETPHGPQHILKLRADLIGFHRVPCEYCIYFRKTDDSVIITSIHIDDFLAGTSTDDAAAKFKADLTTLWKISNLGEAQFCVGIIIEHDLTNHYIYLSQTTLINRILIQF